MIYILLSTGDVVAADDDREDVVNQYRTGTPFIRLVKGAGLITVMTAHVVMVSDADPKQITTLLPA